MFIGPTHPPVSSALCLLKGKPTSIFAPKYMKADTRDVDSDADTIKEIR
jgi:hypothetical protein